jgi:hypothetical protein
MWFYDNKEICGTNEDNDKLLRKGKDRKST